MLKATILRRNSWLFMRNFNITDILLIKCIFSFFLCRELSTPCNNSCIAFGLIYFLLIYLLIMLIYLLIFFIMLINLCIYWLIYLSTSCFQGEVGSPVVHIGTSGTITLIGMMMGGYHHCEGRHSYPEPVLKIINYLDFIDAATSPVETVPPRPARRSPGTSRGSAASSGGSRGVYGLLCVSYMGELTVWIVFYQEYSCMYHSYMGS